MDHPLNPEQSCAQSHPPPQTARETVEPVDSSLQFEHLNDDVIVWRKYQPDSQKQTAGVYMCVRVSPSILLYSCDATSRC